MPNRNDDFNSMKMPYRPLRAALVGVALTMTSHAYASGTEALRNFVAQVHAARGHFVQHQVQQTAPAAAPAASGATLAQRMPARAAPDSSGTFSFARPGKFIWAYRQPYNQVLQADGQTLYVYDKDLNQVTERKLGDALGASPAAILFGSNDLQKNFTLHDSGVKDGVDWLQLTPKAQDTQFKEIAIGFRHGNLQAMELHDVFGNVTLLTFSDIEKNPALPAGYFKFTVPPGADVIKN